MLVTISMLIFFKIEELNTSFTQVSLRFKTATKVGSGKE